MPPGKSGYLIIEVEEMKNIKIIGITLIIIVVIILSLIYFTSSNNEMISGLEASRLAEPYAEEWNESGVLVSMCVTDFSAEPATYLFPQGNAGKFSEWFLTYSVQTNIGDNTSVIQFKVSSNGTVIEKFQIDSSTGIEYEGMISNWIVDSDEAYEIAVSNDAVKS